LAGVTLTEEILDTVAWRLAGNLERLKLHRPALPWCRQEVDEIVPVQILDVYPGYTPTRKFGGTFPLRILAGTPASHIIDQFWTSGYCRLIAQILGFSAPWGKRQYIDLRQFVGLRLSVRIATELSGSAPRFEKLWQEDDKIKPASLYQWNQDVLRMRRRDTFQCPRKYPLDQVQCHFCVVGTDECLAATHEATYTKSYCEVCEKDNWFDPASPQQDLCLECYHKSLRGGDG